MKIHEYQAKAILKRHGVATAEGRVIFDPSEIDSAWNGLKTDIAVLKAQIHAGGRGKGEIFDTPEPTGTPLLRGGVQLIRSAEEGRTVAERMLGNYLHTHQTGESGKKISRLYLETGSKIRKEYYVSLLYDRSTGKPLLMASSEGGMEIETVAETMPEKIVRLRIEPALGLQPWQIRKLLYALEIPPAAHKQATPFFAALWRAFDGEDASILEINPLVLTESDELIALDCKFIYDDNALFRHPDAKELRDPDEEDPLELHASQFNLNYVKLDGNVGCMVNGAGLAMATMDIVKLAGALPANFLDVGGGASAQTVANGFRIILEDPHVRAIFVNIFGGIVQCDRVANGIVEAAKSVNIQVPLVVRLRGTNADLAKEILAESGLAIRVSDELAEAARLVAEAIGSGGES